MSTARPCLLSVAALHVWHGANRSNEAAVHDLNLVVDRGEGVAVLGASGSGKSTLALALAGLLPPTSRVQGGISIDGEALDDAGAWRSARGRRVGSVLQDPATALDPLWRVGDQLAEVVAHHHGLRGAILHDEVARRLREVGLEAHLAERFPHALSGGQQQRAGIALALAGDPGLLVADEPTAALDPAHRDLVLDLLRDLQRARGLALLIVTHDLAVARRVADRVVVMQAGQIVEEGPVGAVLDAPRSEAARALILQRARTGRRVLAPALLEVDRLVVRAPARGSAVTTLLDGVSLRVPRGSILAIAGASGSGKTTLARALVGLAPIVSGSVRIDGREILGPGQRVPKPVAGRVARPAIALLFQDARGSLDPRWTVRRALLALPRRSGEQDSDLLRRLDLRLRGLGLGTEHLDRRPGELSGGEVQRVCLARALAQEPDLLVCDEPTSALDPASARAVLALLEQLRTEQGLTCVVTTHDPLILDTLADEVLHLHEGRTVDSPAP